MLGRPLGILRPSHDLHRRLFLLLCNARSVSTASSGGGGDGGVSKLPASPMMPPQGGLMAEAYRQLDNLDFPTAAKMLFTDPPNHKEKKFGLDFHLVQLFFACMPPLAVYLVALYARHEMNRMDAELEKKKQIEEEKKAKEAELASLEARSDPELLEVITRLDALEVAVKEMADEKRNSVSSKPKGPEAYSKTEKATNANEDSGPRESSPDIDGEQDHKHGGIDPDIDGEQDHKHGGIEAEGAKN